ncbi:MAG: glycosyltransferase family 1 protein [Saprospiraceae bacterium]
MIKGKIEGMGLFTQEVMKRMAEQHPEDEFIFFFDRPFDPAFIFGKNVTPVVLFPPARHPFLFYWWFEWSVAKALKKYRVDVFLSPDNFLSLKTPIKTVLVTHDLAYLHLPVQQSFFQRKYYEIFSPRFNRRADHIEAVSQFTKTDIIKQYGISPEKISVACNGCDDSFHPVGEKEKETIRQQHSMGQPYFFYVGAIHPRKNVHRLIDAFGMFKTATHSSVKLLIAGRFAWQAGEVKNAYDRSDFQQDIHFLGYVPDEELTKLMAGALACTYVSKFEGFGIPILQAMNCDIPVITSNTSSMPEVVGDAGLTVDPNNLQEIAESMQLIWQDAHLRNKLIEAGKKQRGLFSWQKATDVVYAALHRVARKL